MKNNDVKKNIYVLYNQYKHLLTYSLRIYWIGFEGRKYKGKSLIFSSKSRYD